MESTSKQVIKDVDSRPDVNKATVARFPSKSSAHAMSALFWGFLADATSRVTLLSVGCCMWGFVNVFLAMSTSWWHFVILKIFDGIALARSLKQRNLLSKLLLFYFCLFPRASSEKIYRIMYVLSIGPIAQSLIPDMYPTKLRGQQFGWIQMFLSAGSMGGALFGGMFSNARVSGKLLGWRFVFFFCGCLSTCLGLSILYFGEDPPRAVDDSHKPLKQQMMQSFKNFSQATTTRTFLVLILQGICGNIPLHAFSYYTLWFQYIGMTDTKASVLTACPLLGSMVGAVFGGWLGDRAHSISRYSGRPVVGQLSTILAIPLVYDALMVIPRDPAQFSLFALNMFLLGFVVSWAPSGVNRPILSDVVRFDVRATVFATLATFEGSMAAILGSPVIAFMAESLFGFRLSNKSAFGDKNLQVNAHYRTGFFACEANKRNHLINSICLQALAEALLIATAFPWTLSFIMYSLLHFTYKEDAIAAKWLAEEKKDDDYAGIVPFVQ
ncbi:transporter, major facilitator family protein, partial [Cardiosporidium cionae]